MPQRRLWKLPTLGQKAFLPEDECEGCGIGYLGLIETVSPFVPACLVHDLEFSLKEHGKQTKSRAQVDREFLENMLRVATTFRLRALAYVYYGLARSLGGLFW
jgi:hypothetical protein